MDEKIAKSILDETIGQIFRYQNPLSLEQAMLQFAFDVRLPQQVYDVKTNQPTWTASMGQNRYATMQGMQKMTEGDGNMRPARNLTNLQDVLGAWNEINFTSTDRQIGSKNVAESDGVYHSDGVYRSVDIRKSNNILFSDGVDGCDHVVAGQTSKRCNFVVRVEDSKDIVNSFNIIWSSKIANSMFIQDCYDLDECLFCSNIAGKRFCIANMQYEEAEYRRIKDIVARWVLQSA